METEYLEKQKEDYTRQPFAHYLTNKFVIYENIWETACFIDVIPKKFPKILSHTIILPGLQNQLRDKSPYHVS